MNISFTYLGTLVVGVPRKHFLVVDAEKK